MEIKSIGVLSAAKVVGGVYFGIGLIFGLLSACFGIILFAGLMAEGDAGLASISGGFYLAGLCIGPIMYGIIGFISGAIGAVIYNLVAKYIGGLELDLSQKM